MHVHAYIPYTYIYSIQLFSVFFLVTLCASKRLNASNYMLQIGSVLGAQREREGIGSEEYVLHVLKFMTPISDVE